MYFEYHPGYLFLEELRSVLESPPQYHLLSVHHRTYPKSVEQVGLIT